MGFNEKVHAYIAAKYYLYLTEMFNERGKEAFIHATRYYAEQRGRRMAQRAIRDNKELTYDTYMEYGEWVNTQEIIDEGCSNKSKIISTSPDLIMHIFTCPWYTQFKEMGLIEAGHTYCHDLDRSICRGFNPDIDYIVTQTLHKSDYCCHIIKNANIHNGNHEKKYLKDFEYHCAHSFFAYREVTLAIFKEEGNVVIDKVLNDFKNDYGQAMTDNLLKYKDTNFNICED